MEFLLNNYAFNLATYVNFADLLKIKTLSYDWNAKMANIESRLYSNYDLKVIEVIYPQGSIHKDILCNIRGIHFKNRIFIRGLDVSEVPSITLTATHTIGISYYCTSYIVGARCPSVNSDSFSSLCWMWEETELTNDYELPNVRLGGDPGSGLWFVIENAHSGKW